MNLRKQKEDEARRALALKPLRLCYEALKVSLVARLSFQTHEEFDVENGVA